MILNYLERQLLENGRSLGELREVSFNSSDFFGIDDFGVIVIAVHFKTNNEYKKFKQIYLQRYSYL